MALKKTTAQSELCDVCGKEMFDPDINTHLFGLRLDIDFTAAPHSQAFLHRQFGPFWRDGMKEMHFRMCFECWFRAFGLDPGRYPS